MLARTIVTRRSNIGHPAALPTPGTRARIVEMTARDTVRPAPGAPSADKMSESLLIVAAISTKITLATIAGTTPGEGAMHTVAPLQCNWAFG